MTSASHTPVNGPRSVSRVVSNTRAAVTAAASMTERPYPTATRLRGGGVAMAGRAYGGPRKVLSQVGTIMNDMKPWSDLVMSYGGPNEGRRHNSTATLRIYCLR